MRKCAKRNAFTHSHVRAKFPLVGIEPAASIPSGPELYATYKMRISYAADFEILPTSPISPYSPILIERADFGEIGEIGENRQLSRRHRYLR